MKIGKRHCKCPMSQAANQIDLFSKIAKQTKKTKKKDQNMKPFKKYIK